MHSANDAKLKVLVVENEWLLRLSVLDMLEDMGHEGLEAPDGGAAIRLLDDGSPVDVILIDVGLPDMDGRDLARAARRLRPDLQMVFVSGHRAERLQQAAADLTAEFLPKPYRLEDLRRTLDGMTLTATGT